MNSRLAAVSRTLVLGLAAGSLFAAAAVADPITNFQFSTAVPSTLR